MLIIDGGGYDTAAEAYLDGNHAAADCYAQLTGALGSYTGMAGDDSTSTDFARSYDDAAQQAVHALVDLVGALGNLGALTEATRHNHARAEATSVIAGAVIPAGDVDSVSDARRVDVMPCTPPSALGANGYDLPGHVDWILDHIEGFVWPSGDPDRLRAAAQTWRDTAGRVEGLRTYCSYAIRGLGLEHSPEIPIALAATESLEHTITDLVAHLTDIAAACESYAASVEEKHTQIIDLAQWLLEQFVEGVLISAAIGFLTGGAGAAASMSAVITKVTAESPRFAALLTTLRTLAQSTATDLRATRAALDTSRLRLAKFNRAGLRAARGERATLEAAPEPWPRGWLDSHELHGHTVARHTGKSDEELLQRLTDSTKVKRSSSFTSQEVAESQIERALPRHEASIKSWLGGDEKAFAFDASADSSVGRCAERSGRVFDTSDFRVVLKQDATRPEGYYILTAYPIP